MSHSHMSYRRAAVAGAVGCLLTGVVASPAHAELAYVATSTHQLIGFDTDAPAVVTSTVTITGLAAGESIVGIDLRPANGLLYGLGSTGQIYLIQPMSGVASAVGMGGLPLQGSAFGFDFNPVVDRLRIVSDSNQNLRANPNDGALAATDGTLTPASLVVAAAYTNSFAGTSSTLLYGIDAQADTLVTQDPPNDGVLNVVGPLGIDVGGAAGFDIAPSTNAAFLAARVGGQTRLYAVNLSSGAASDIGTIGDGTMEVAGFALATRAAMLWGLTASNALVGFNSTAPGLTTAPLPVTGLQAGEQIVGIDFRPATGQLYGIGSTSRIYTLDRTTGQATAIGTGPFTPALDGTAFGVDFNPTVDRIRLVSNTGQNLRLHPDTGAVVAVDGALSPATAITAAAYTNNMAGAMTTTLFDIDSGSGALVRQDPPNAGGIQMVGPLGVTVDDVNGFDISALDGTAFAALTVAGTASLYTVNLTTGAATAIGTIGTGGALRGLAAEVPLSYAFAEGATGFFSTDLAIANPHVVDVPVSIVYLTGNGGSVAQTLTLAPQSRVTVSAASVPGLSAAEFGTVVTSTAGYAIGVERTMRWDASGYGMHGEQALSGPALTWYFAEGSQGFFDTYLLLVNPTAMTNTATVQFLVEGGAPVTRSFTLGPTSRFNVVTGLVPELAGRSFGAIVTFTAPALAERAMYFGTPLFNGGSAAAGVTAPSTTWYHAEGATGDYFDLYLLLANPGMADATATLTYYLPSGAPVVKTKVVPAASRLTVNVEADDPLLGDTAVAIAVTADQPILSERAMYWPGSSDQWFESHASWGLTQVSTRWIFAEGRVGGPEAYETYLLMANPSATAVTATVRFLKTDGTTIERDVTVPANARVNLHVNTDVPELANESFGAVVLASGPLFAERAMYANADGVVWAAGSSATGARLP